MGWFTPKPDVVTPPLETGEGDGPKLGDLRVKIHQSSIPDYEWFVDVEIFDRNLYDHFPRVDKWLPWSYWAEYAAVKFYWRRGVWPESSDWDETEEGAKAKGCAMLRAVREFQPVIVPEAQYLTEEDCK